MHALIECSRSGLIIGEHPNLVFCSVPTSQDLVDLCSLLELKSIDYRTFVEPDLDDKLTAIATKVVFGKDRKPFSKLELV